MNKLQLARRDAWLDLERDQKKMQESYDGLVQVMDFLQTLPIMHSEAIDSRISAYRCGVMISLKHIPFEMAIDLLAGPIHREFNADWRLQLYYASVDLITEIHSANVRIEVINGDFRGCEVKVIEEVDPNWKPEPKTRTRLEMVCSDE